MQTTECMKKENYDSVYELINMKLKFETCASGRDVYSIIFSNGIQRL